MKANYDSSKSEFHENLQHAKDKLEDAANYILEIKEGKGTVHGSRQIIISALRYLIRAENAEKEIKQVR